MVDRDLGTVVGEDGFPGRRNDGRGGGGGRREERDEEEMEEVEGLREGGSLRKLRYMGGDRRERNDGHI